MLPQLMPTQGRLFVSSIPGETGGPIISESAEIRSNHLLEWAALLLNCYG